MNLRTNTWSLAYALLAVSCPLVAVAADPSGRLLTPDRFARLHQLIKPAADEEKWAQIPWLTSLWQARQRALAEAKPILLWEMDGNPLGCT